MNKTRQSSIGAALLLCRVRARVLNFKCHPRRVGKAQRAHHDAPCAFDWWARRCTPLPSLVGSVLNLNFAGLALYVEFLTGNQYTILL